MAEANSRPQPSEAQPRAAGKPAVVLSSLSAPEEPAGPASVNQKPPGRLDVRARAALFEAGNAGGSSPAQPSRAAAAAAAPAALAGAALGAAAAVRAKSSPSKEAPAALMPAPAAGNSQPQPAAASAEPAAAARASQNGDAARGEPDEAQQGSPVQGLSTPGRGPDFSSDSPPKPPRAEVCMLPQPARCPAPCMQAELCAALHDEHCSSRLAWRAPTAAGFLRRGRPRCWTLSTRSLARARPAPSARPRSSRSGSRSGRAAAGPL